MQLTPAIYEVIDWLVQDGQHVADLGDFFAEFIPRMRRAGLPIDRIQFGYSLLHPLFAAQVVTWDDTMAAPQVAATPLATTRTPAWTDNPIAAVIRTGRMLRRRLLDGPRDFRILPELVEAGYWDYVALPIRTRGRMVAVITCASRRPDAFDVGRLLQLRGLLAAAAPIFGAMQAERFTTDLLTTYLGPQTGARVRDGRIRLGDVEAIEAVLWLCDLHDFSTLTHALGAEAMVPLVNTYFEVMAAALVAHGGEILKFMGDAMLAFFPVTAVDPEGPDVRAVTAAREALDALTALSSARVERGETALRTSIALDRGRVLYGNIGAERRLDFTVFGPAVNRLTRIERLCGALDVPLLMSSAVAARAGVPVESRGAHRVKGEADPIEVFTVR